MEFEMAAVFDMVSVFEIFTEVTIPRKISTLRVVKKQRFFEGTVWRFYY